MHMLTDGCHPGALLLQAMMKVGDEFLATQLTVMENNDMPFLFGLDMLRRHQCQIDLK